MPEPKTTKAYRVYRGGRAKNDPDAARFSFGQASNGSVAAPPRSPTPEGLPAPDMGPPQRPLPGRQVATTPPGGRRRWLGWKRGIALGSAVVLLLFGFWLFLGYRSFSSEMAKANQRLDPRTRAALTPAGNILTSPQISLILGSDSRGKGTSARADSILLVRTDPSHHLISMLSIPRDLRVPIPGHGDDKINAAYAFGGPSLLIRTVNALTGFRVNHIVLVDFTGFEDLVNSLGGITINNPTRVVSSQPFEGVKWRFPKGQLHLGGRWALAYARIRKTTNPSDTDISRTIRQQRVMQGIVHKLATPSSLLNLPAVGREIAKPLTTDLSALQVLGLAWIKFRANRTLQCHLGGAFASIGGQDVVVSSDQNRSVVQMFLGESAPLPSPKGDPFAPGCTIG